MKKVASVFIVVLLFAVMGCGGGGGGGTSGIPGIPAGGGGGGTGGGGTDIATGPVGTVTVRIAGPASRVPLRAGAPSLPAWQEVRIIVQQEFYDEEGNMSFLRWGLEDKIPSDFEPGAPPVVFTVPATSGYTVVILFSTVSGSVHTMWAYGKSDPFTVSPGANADVSIATHPIFEYINIFPPTTVNNNQLYSVGVYASGPVEQGNYRFKVGEGTSTGSTPFTDTYSSVPNDVYSGLFVTFTAPNKGSSPSNYGTSPYDNTYNLHFQGRFFANSSVLQTGELSSNWTFTCPNYSYNDPVLTHLVPDGGIDIIIDYP